MSEMNEYKIVHIGVVYDYSRFACEQMKKNSDAFYYCLDLHFSLHGIRKILYKIHNSKRINRFVKLPFKSIWARFVVDRKTQEHLGKNDKICFIYKGGESYLDIRAFQYLKKKYPDCICVYSLNDLASLPEKLYANFYDRLKKAVDIITTYNSIDASERGFVLSPPAVFDYSDIIGDDCEECDVFFIGNEKGRYPELISLYERCINCGLKCEFYIMNVPKDKQKYARDIHYDERLPYVKVLEHVKKSRSVLNLTQEGAQGITLRDYECIGMNKVLLTNNRYIKTTEFYTEDKIVFTDDLEKSVYKIVQENEGIEWSGKNIYSLKNYFRWLNNLLARYKEKTGQQ